MIGGGGGVDSVVDCFLFSLAGGSLGSLGSDFLGSVAVFGETLLKPRNLFFVQSWRSSADISSDSTISIISGSSSLVAAPLTSSF